MELQSIDAMTSIVDFNSNVSIFRNTRAVDVSDKINAVAEAIKEHTNDEVIASVNTYVNGELHPKLQGIADTLETTMNDYTTGMNNDWNDYTTTTNATVAQLISDTDDEVANFEATTLANISNYTSTVTGYTTDQSNSLSFAGSTGDVVRDDKGNMEKWTIGNKTSEVLTVNGFGSILTASETIVVDGITTVKNFTFVYENDGLTIKSITEV